MRAYASARPCLDGMVFLVPAVFGVDHVAMSPPPFLIVPSHFLRSHLISLQVLANAREDATLASARRAVRLLGTFCDIPSLADAALSSLEIPYPRYRRTRSAGVRVTANRTGGVGIGENGHRPQLALSRFVILRCERGVEH